ncbi:hypothetical protein FQA39_LY15905 [Lamprigera yunnana]|nr:hypothetical protein FQA39_LY15905 [Lamprigera yunnana]
MEKNNAIKQFSKITNCDLLTTCKILDDCKWDVETAINKWKHQTKCHTTPPPTKAKKFSRGFSEAFENTDLVCKARNALATDFEKQHLDDFISTPEVNFYLPDFTKFEIDFQEFLINDLIDKQVMNYLQSKGKLNWWCDTIGFENRLWPLLTSGDGNCLLHAASLSMFGFHDRVLTLRKALHSFMLNDNHIIASIKRRWRWHETKIYLPIGVERTESEWDKEWAGIIDSTSIKSTQGSYQGLEAIHILCLAHVLRRVIIVVAEDVARDSEDEPLSPIYFDGIYIPFAYKAKQCLKNPLFLIYNQNHFSALVFMKTNPQETTQFFIPITHYEDNYIPIRFFVDPGAEFNWNKFSDLHYCTEELKNDSKLLVISDYLEIIDFYNIPKYTEPTANKIDKGEATTEQLQNVSKAFNFLKKYSFATKEKDIGPLFCVNVNIKKNAFQNEIINNYMKAAKERFDNLTCFKPENQVINSPQNANVQVAYCINECGNYGTEETCYLCKTCYDEHKERLEGLEDAKLCFSAGKSKFYVEPNTSGIKKLPKPTLTSNNTLYLSNSTFFNDGSKPYRFDLDLDDYDNSFEIELHNTENTPKKIKVTDTNSLQLTDFEKICYAAVSNDSEKSSNDQI